MCRAKSVAEPASTGPDIVELTESPSPQRCHIRATSLDLGDASSSPLRRLRASTEQELSPLAMNVTGEVCPREVVDEVEVKKEPVFPAKRPRIIARFHSPSPPIILSSTEQYQSRKQRTTLIKQADHARVQHDLEEHKFREVGEARFLVSSYQAERQKLDNLERDSKKELKARRTWLRELKTRMKEAKAKEHRARGQLYKPKKHKVQQQMSANVTQANHNQAVGPQSRPFK